MKKNSAIFFIVLLAIAIRFVYVHPFINSMPATYDGMIFDDVATNVIEHGQFRLSPDSPEKKVFYSVKEGLSWRPPVYPLFLAGIYKIFGHNFASVRIIEILIAGLTVFLVYFTGKKFFNAKTGLLASLIIALYPPFIQFSGYFMRENILVFFMMPLLYYLLKISFNEKISYMDFLVTGVILGLTALLRTVVIVYAPLFILAFLFMRGKRFLNYVKPLTIAIIAMLLVIMPWTVRNFMVHHKFVFIASNGGSSFFIGNNPAATGTNSQVEGRLPVVELSLERKAVLEKLDEPGADAQFFKWGIEYVKANPVRYIMLDIKKAFIFWMDSYGSYKTPYGAVTRLFDAVLLIAGFLGVVLSFRQWRKYMLIYALMLSFMLAHALFFVVIRNRFPVIPAMAMFAAYGILSFKEILKSGSNRKCILASVIVAIIYIIYHSYRLAV